MPAGLYAVGYGVCESEEGGMFEMISESGEHVMVNESGALPGRIFISINNQATLLTVLDAGALANALQRVSAEIENARKSK